MATTDIRKKPAGKRIHRGTQVIFGERQHLREVLKSIKAAPIPRARKLREIRHLQALIRARTGELEGINPGWDRKFKKAQDVSRTAAELLRLAQALPENDFLLARVLTDHAQAPAELLARFASHPYAAVRENVARHPRTPVEILARMAEDDTEPLWLLVACNPSTPEPLRTRLRERLQAVHDKQQ